MAKKKLAETAPPAPKKRRRAKRIVAKRSRARRAQRAVSHELRDNPAGMADLAEFVLPGFAGYAATRLVSRVAYVQLSKRYPGAAKHLAVGSTLASAAAAWFLVHRVKRIAKYHTPVVVGASIAALQTLIQTYLPKFGWIVSDVQQAELASKPATQLDDGEDLDEGTGADDLSDIDMSSVGSLAGSTIPDIDDEDDLYE